MINIISDWFKVADIHANRIQLAQKKIQHLFPIDAKALTVLSDDDLVWIELLTSRFGKLQDFIGKKLINVFLEQNEEDTNNLTMLDKINKLERFGLIENASVWGMMRETRNHIAHEYPDSPELTAVYLNQIYDLCPKLLSLLTHLKTRCIKN